MTARFSVTGFLCAAVWLVATPPLAAQRYSFKLYGQEEGLKNLTVQALLQDRTGFLWVGTENGLFRYDGERFQRWGEKAGLTAQRIASLHESADGALWVGTEAGLYRRAGERFQLVELGAGEKAALVLAIASDRQGRLYVGTETRLLVGQFGGNSAAPSFRWQPAPGGRSNQGAAGIHVDADDVVWYGCGSGLCRLGGAGAGHSAFGRACLREPGAAS